MDKLPNSEPREYEEVKKSFNHWIEQDKDSKIKRLQQLGRIKDWYLDHTVHQWLKEAENCYIMGFFFGASFFAGATLELGMKLHALSWQPPMKFSNFEKMIDEFYKRRFFNKEEKEIAHELRIIRNNYGHSKIDELAKEAQKSGIKVLKRSIILTNKGENHMPDTNEEIIEKAEDDDMKLTFTQFNAEPLAWKSIKNVYLLLFKLFPFKSRLKIEIKNNTVKNFEFSFSR